MADSKCMWSKVYLLLFSFSLLAGCTPRALDPFHYLVRSDVITSKEKHDSVVRKAYLTSTDDRRIRVLFVQGTPYERGYQQGVLLRQEIQDNLGLLFKNSLKTFYFEELFAEVYERMRPYIPQEYIDEMHGLAHGAKVPLKLVHFIHILPEITEWGGKKKLKERFMQMLKGGLIPSCSNLCALNTATPDKALYSARILDWGLHRISKLHEYPLITISIPDKGYPSANIGWVGFIGAVSGMNARGITLGEMGNGNPENETLRGKPMPFMLRDVMTYADSLKDVRRIIKSSLGTNAFGFLMTDGKRNEAEIYVKDRDQFLAFKPGQDLKDDRSNLPGIKDIVYGGHFDEKMHDILNENKGIITPTLLMEKIIPEIVMKSNFQNVVYDPKHLRFWVNNAKSKNEPAYTQPYTYFDFGKALNDFSKRSSQERTQLNQTGAE